MVKTRVTCRFRTALSILVASLFPVFAAPGKEWRTYDNCHLLDKEGNDGDSFHMKYSRPGYARTYYIRLYWVDCPESDKSFPDRVKEQAEWWGISEDDVIKMGKEATRFTKKLLKDGFVVHSKLQDARGRSDKKRYYANVTVEGEYLAELLVANGYARIYGYDEVHEGGPKPTTFKHRLKAAEAEAKRNKVGVWALPGKQDNPYAIRTPTLTRPTTPRPPLRKSAPPVTPATPTLERPPLEEQEVTLGRHLRVFSLKDGRHVGTLKPGNEVTVLGDEGVAGARIRFLMGERMIEAKCQRADLGL